MKFTYTHITKESTTSTTYIVDKNNEVKVQFEHDKFLDFDTWFNKLIGENGTTEYGGGELPDEAYDEQIKQYEENKLNKYY